MGLGDTVTGEIEETKLYLMDMYWKVNGSKQVQNEREKKKDIKICLWWQTVFVTGHVCMCPR